MTVGATTCGCALVAMFEVRKRVALQRARKAGVSIFNHIEECDMEPVFDDLAAHLEVLAGE